MLLRDRREGPQLRPDYTAELSIGRVHWRIGSFGLVGVAFVTPARSHKFQYKIRLERLKQLLSVGMSPG